MKATVLLIVTLSILSSCSQEESTSTQIGFDKKDSNYHLLCLDESQKDTLVMIDIDFNSDSAELKISDRIDLGLELNLNWEDNSKFYELYVYKLKRPIGGAYKTKLVKSKHFFPSNWKNSTEQTFANATLLVMQNTDSTLFTTDNDGFGDNLKEALFELSWFPNIQNINYTIIEYYQDSERSWLNVLSK